MAHLDRRGFVTLAVGAAVTPLLSGLAWSGLSTAMAARVDAMREAMAKLELVGRSHDAFRQSCDDMGLIARDGFWGWYQAQPVRVEFQQVLERARSEVEAAFMMRPETASDEDAVMMALAAYEEIHPSAFAMQTARDLFTPRRYQTCSRDRLRHWLLTDPDEYFVKSGMPGFLRTMRERHRALAISA